MKDIKSFYNRVICVAMIVLSACFIGLETDMFNFNNFNHKTDIPNTNFGGFLAAQHALRVNDFDAAAKMLAPVDADIDLVKQTKILTEFFNGVLPEKADSLKNAKDLSGRLIYDAYLINKNDWKSVYNRHSKEDSMFMIPLRVFSAVHQGKKQEAIKYINTLQTNDSWKAFLRGQIAVLNNDVSGAAKEFANVHPDFMNINDYLYLMSFYKHNDMTEDMEILRYDFISKSGAMYLYHDENIPDWSNYEGYTNNLVFGIIQNISHTRIMVFTDFSLVLLKFANIISENKNIDEINYYMGQYYFYNSGDFESSFNAISKNHPLYLFGQMKIAESKGDISKMKEIANKNPLFVPAVKVMISNAVKNGDKRTALRYVNRALRQKNISDEVRMFFLKNRANIYLLFNQPKKAQKDIDAVLGIDDRLLSDVLLLQARTWAAQDRELDKAYDYAMTLVKRNTSDVVGWDILGVIVEKREGIDAALELVERVGEVAATASSLYEHLGDMYVKKGNKEAAKKSYLRALDLADDGLIVVPFVEKKLRKLK